MLCATYAPVTILHAGTASCMHEFPTCAENVHGGLSRLNGVWSCCSCCHVITPFGPSPAGDRPVLGLIMQPLGMACWGCVSMLNGPTICAVARRGGAVYGGAGGLREAYSGRAGPALRRAAAVPPVPAGHDHLLGLPLPQGGTDPYVTLHALCQSFFPHTWLHSPALPAMLPLLSPAGLRASRACMVAGVPRSRAP